MQRFLAVLFVVVLSAPSASGEDLTATLSPKELQAASNAVDRGLDWLARQQNPDGSFSGMREQVREPLLEPTGYAVMAFLSRGHQPSQGRYGRLLDRAIDFVLSKQRADGSLSTRPRDQIPLLFEHAISGLTLSEVYGFTSGARMRKIEEAIPKALASSRRFQMMPKLYPEYRGGWHYADRIGPRANHSGMVFTSWEMIFLRSAHNAGFEVPQTWIDEGLQYVERCYKSGPRIVADRRVPVATDQGVFFWYPKPAPGNPLWANFNTTASGMLALQLHGQRDNPMVQKTAAWLAANTIPAQGTTPSFYWGCYFWSQAMSQVGGKYWENLYPRVVRKLMPHQHSDGHWQLERFIGWGEDRNGPEYRTAVAVLCLTLPDQLLPIHQR